MKKNIVCLIICCVYFSAFTQEIIVPEAIKELRKQQKDYFAAILLAKENSNVSDSVIMILETFMNTGEQNFVKENLYLNYADLLAQYEFYDKSIHYYDLAFKNKKMIEEAFLYPYRKKYFSKDTLLYKQKCAEYLAKSVTQFTPTEMKIIVRLKELVAADQMARNYYSDFPSEKNLTEHNLIIYVDTINKRKIIELIQEYPEIENPLALDLLANILFGRHLFTAYPDFWLDYFEPIARKRLLEGQYDAQTYARTYDRTVITSSRESYSFYGEWDNDGKNVNPDSAAVNRRRINLGLPLLEDKPKNENKFFITY